MLQSWLNPRWRVGLFLLSANAAWLSATWLWADRTTWLWILPIALSINALLVTYDQILSVRIVENNDDADAPEALQLRGQDGWGLLRTVRELCERVHVEMPKVYLIERNSAQIFAYNRTRKSAQLFVTTGALDLLTPRQLRAVLTFELLVIRGSYHVLNYWLSAWLDLLNRFGRVVERAFRFVFGWTPPLAAWLIGPWVLFVHIFMLGRADFDRLDQAAMRLVDHPEDLAFALWKLDCYAQTRPWQDAWIFAHMFIVSPLRLPAWTNLLKVQPALPSRLKNIAGRYPL